MRLLVVSENKHGVDDKRVKQVATDKLLCMSSIRCSRVTCNRQRQLSINSINKCITCDSETPKRSLNFGIFLYGKRTIKFPDPEIVNSFLFNMPIQKYLTESKYPSDQI